jgi:dUTP pyrophosphatase
MKLSVSRIDRDLPLPKYETNGAFAFDFLAREETKIKPQTLAYIPGNLVVQCPADHALLILPRSSAFRKTQLIFPHSIGLIDQDYCGEADEIMIQVYNLGSESVIIKRGQKIAQGLLVKVARAKIEETHRPSENSRGGFGSTD